MGNNGVGKTSLIMAQVEGSGHPEYLSFVFDCTTAVSTPVERVAVEDSMMQNGVRRESLFLWDTSFTDRLCPQCYNHADVFILCFSLVCPTSYRHVYTKWYLEIVKYAPNTPIVLVGLKHDLRADERTIRRLREEDGKAPITREEGERLRNDIGALGYVECSSRDLCGVSQVFHETVKAAVVGDGGDCSKEKKFIFW